MSDTDRDLIELWARGALGDLGLTDCKTEVKRVFRRTVVCVPRAASGAAVDVAETTVFQLPATLFANGALLVECKLCTDGTVTQDAANVNVITVAKRAAADFTTAVTMATYDTTTTTGNGTATAFTPKTFTLAAEAALTITAGSVVTVKNVHASSGVALPTHSIELTFEAT